MRKNITRQLSLVSSRIDHEHARELQRMSELLDALPRAAAGVTKDLLQGRGRHSGRPGMTGEQALRCAVVMRVSGLSYRQLAFHLADSTTYRSFCRFGLGDRTPRVSTLQGNLKRIRPETLERVNRMLVRHAAAQGVEDGGKVRPDSTVVGSNIHHPTDSSLLWDCVRKLTTLLNKAREHATIHFSDHRKRAKRRALAIGNAKRMSQREPLYRDLLKVTGRAVGYAEAAIKALGRCRSTAAARCAVQLKSFVARAARVIDQTERRVFGGEALPPQEKLVSIFEPHTDIIIKDNREICYGHKAFVSIGGSGLVLDFVLKRGNPSDAKLAEPLVHRHAKLFGQAPKQASFDGGFATQSNLSALKTAGVHDVAFAKKCGLRIEEMTRSNKVYKQLRRFRAGAEAFISFLKRSFGFGRCNWRGYDSFHAYAWTSVLSANLLVFARHTMDHP